MLTIICGTMGSGKTLLSTILAYHSKYDCIVSNYHIKFEHKTVLEFDIKKFINAEYENCCLLLDEAYSYLESRISGSDLNRLISYILFQSRKKNIDMYLTAQLISTLDLRFRNLCDFYIVATKNMNYFEYNILNVYSNQSKTIYINKSKCNNFFQLYDTNEIILPNLKGIQDKILTGNQKMQKANEIATEIIEKYDETRITFDLVQSYCIEYEIPKFLEKMIWVQVKLLKTEEKKKEKELKN